MRRWLAAGLSAALLGATGVAASAQQMGVWQRPTASGPTYVGEGDLRPGAVMYWGTRSYNAAYATGSNPAMELFRESDSTYATFNILTSGAMDDAGATTFCSGTTCHVVLMYNQAGSATWNLGVLGDVPGTIDVFGPIWVPNCQNGHSCLKVTPSTRALAALHGPTFTPATGVETVTLVFESLYPGSGSVDASYLITSQGFNGAGFSDNATGNSNYITLEGAAVLFVITTPNLPTSYVGTLNGASSVITLNGTDTTGTATPNGSNSFPEIGAEDTDSTTSYYWMTGGIWDNLTTTSPQRQANCSNQKAWWNLTAATCP